MGDRPSCAPQCHFQRGLNSVSHRHTIDLRNVRVYVSNKTSAPISKARHERNIHLLLETYLKDNFFLPFCFFLKLKWINQKGSQRFPCFFFHLITCGVGALHTWAFLCVALLPASWMLE